MYRERETHLLIPHLEAGDAGLLGGGLEVLGQQLALLVEVVAGADVDEGVEGPALPPPHELGGVVLLPLGLVVAEVAAEGLLAPGAAGGVADGGPGRDAPVGPRVLEVQRQRAVAAHGVARDGDAAHVELLELGGQQLGELVGEVGLHAVVVGVGGLDGVDVEGGGAAEVVGVVLAGEVGAARGGVGEGEGQPGGRGVRVQEALLRHVVGRAGQAGEVEQEGRRGGGGGGGREEDVEVHGRLGGGGLVRQLEELAAEGGDGGVCRECHFCVFLLSFFFFFL